MTSGAPFGEAARVALGSLQANKLRSFLTLLGIILATSTLIAVMALIHGMDVYVASAVSDMGADGFRIVRMAFFGNFDPKKFLEFLRKNPELGPDEFDFLQSKATMVKALGIGSSRQVRVSSGKEYLLGVSLDGASPNMAEISNIQPLFGRFFTDAENRRHVPVAFIGNDI